MPTYFIVDSKTNPLGPNEIRAGDTIEVEDGDIFIFESDADKNTKFESADGTPTDFQIWIDDSNSNDFDIEIQEDLNVTFDIGDDVDISDVAIKASDADSVTLTAGDNFSLGSYEGSKDGADTLTIGDGFTTDKAIKTEGGDDTIILGNDASIDDIETGAGDDTIIVGDGLDARKFKTEDGDDTIVIGDDATMDDIETKDGDDSVTIGDGFSGDKIKTGDGADDVTIGDGATIDDLETGKGPDEVVIGDDFTADKLKTFKGDDSVTIGANAVIDELDGGKDIDRLRSETDFPDATGFEDTVCFVQGTRILTDQGEIPVQRLKVGDRVVTMHHGHQKIRWIGFSTVAGHGRLAPIRFSRGVMGNRRPLFVSPQHRMYVSGWQTETLFGLSEALVAAKHLVDGNAVSIEARDKVAYFHILFDQHEIVFAEGAPSESFHPGAVGLGAIDEAAREEIYALFPELRADPWAFGPAAIPSLKSREGRLLRAA
ncbi:MAG: Hint domain-containing protein [Paracoccaceae bacterium]